MDEREIIALLRAHDEAGAEALARRYGPLMRYLIAPILSDERDREECFNDVLLRVWEKIGLYDEERGSFTAWLTALTRNAALTRARRRLPAEDALEEEVSPDPTPEDMLIAAERCRILLDAVASLTREERALFWRKYYYRQSTEQIAAETGLTVRAAEGRLYRIRKKLRGMLGGEFV
ncbi:MAG: sigma-70 family RNA polymerase sigma factor [Clostridia bacterium]|nr:sigma-70 family RNA polymerase sigma factor [Clostridia bacterium]